jgi:hypothetical protein
MQVSGEAAVEEGQALNFRGKFVLEAAAGFRGKIAKTAEQQDFGT